MHPLNSFDHCNVQSLGGAWSCTVLSTAGAGHRYSTVHHPCPWNRSPVRLLLGIIGIRYTKNTPFPNLNAKPVRWPYPGISILSELLPIAFQVNYATVGRALEHQRLRHLDVTADHVNPPTTLRYWGVANESSYFTGPKSAEANAGISAQIRTLEALQYHLFHFSFFVTL